MNKVVSPIMFGASTIAAMLCSASALAQTAPPSGGDDVAQQGGIGEIVVTAQRRAESIQKTSVSISVLSADDLAKGGVTQGIDIAGSVPGLQIASGGSNTQIYIRGVGDFGSTAATNPAVAFNVDGVYVARSTSIEGNFYDVERIEVLKGPQGTLYGRNASGGAINLITNKPKLGVREMAGAIEIGNYSKRLAEAAVNLPIGDTLAVRIAGQVIDRGPYSTFGFNDEVRQSVRGQLLFSPNDNLTLRVGADYTHVGGGGGGYVGLNIPGVSPWASVSDPRVTPFYDLAAVRQGRCAPVGIPGSPGGLSTYQGACPNLVIPAGPLAGTYRQNALLRPATGLRAETNNNYYSIFGQLDYTFGDVTLTLLPAYRSSDVEFLALPGLGYYDNSLDGEPETSRATSMEARLSYESDKLKVTLGGFYFNEKQTGTFLISFGLLQDLAQSQIIKTESYAAFGQATYSLTDTFRVIGGLRYTTDNRDVTYASYAMNGSPVNPDGSLGYFGALAAGCVPEVPIGAVTSRGCRQFLITGGTDVKKVNWRAGVEFDVGPENMLYASASTGLKAGGVAIAQSAPGVPLVYKPENLTAYEIGSRNRFFDNRLQINLEGFYYDYRNHQETFVGVDGTGAPNQLILNADKGRAIGGSADIVFMPTPNDRLRAGVEFNDTKYTDFTFQSRFLAATGPFISADGSGCAVTTSTAILTQTIDCSGKPFTRAPKWTGLVSYTRTFDLADGSELEFEGNVQFQSSRFLGAEYREESRADANQVYNAVATYSSPDGNWSISAYVRNITNEAVYTSSFRSNFAQSFITATINPPRTYGARLNFKF